MFCVAVGLAGNVPGAQLSPLGLVVVWLFWPKAPWTAAPAQAGNTFSKKGTGWIELTSVPPAAAFDSIVAAVKYLVLLAASFKLTGMARSTCNGSRRPTLPTYASCSDDRELSCRERVKLNMCV